MFKFHGREDKVRNEEVFDGNTIYDSIELYANDDSKSGQDIGRPINNIYDNQYKLYKLIEAQLNNSFTQGNLGYKEGIFQGSFQEFDIDFAQVNLDNGVGNQDYLRVAPGAAMARTYNSASANGVGAFQVYLPETYVASRKIAKILNLNLPAGRDSCEIKYHFSSDRYKARIVKKDLNANTYSSYYYGCVDDAEFEADSLGSLNNGVELLAEMYNEPDFTQLIDDAIGSDFTLIGLEPMFLVTAIDDYYVSVDEQNNGNIVFHNTTQPDENDYFTLLHVDVQETGSGSFSGSANIIGNYINDVININAETGLNVSINGASILDGDDLGNTTLTGDTTITIDSPETTVTGNLTVSGTTTTVDTEDLVITDNTITLNNGESGPGVTLGEAGLLIKRGDGASAGEEDVKLVFKEADDQFYAGIDGSELQVALVADPQDTYGIVWNDTTKRYETSTAIGGGTTFTPVDEFDFDSQTDFDWSVRDTGTNPITTAEQAMNTNRQDLYEYVELMSTEGANYQVAAGASLIGCAALPGITPSGKTSGSHANLQALLDGMINPNVTELYYREATTVDGDATVALTWNKVLVSLDTRDEIGDSYISSSTLRLPAGKYDVEAHVMSSDTGKNKVRLYDSANSATLLYGYPNDSPVGQTNMATMVGQIVLADTTTFQLELYSELVGTMGVATGDGSLEIYAKLKITQRG